MTIPLSLHKPGSGALAYRADIDGLRALAIVPVVLYHAGVRGFGGGFVGVDVFFVISGFLMASLISGEIARGDFSLLRFYERRIRRILPALLAVMTASAVAAWFLLMPAEMAYFARSLKATALIRSNIQFEKESGYFDIAAQLKPLVHTWSLSVEEQFYVLFPLLLVTLTWFGRRSPVSVLTGLLMASFAASAWMVLRSPVSAFYLLQFRAWELLLGALLAFNAFPAPERPMLRAGMATGGVLLIVVAVFGFNNRTPFPGPAALLPCLGAALVIHARDELGPAGRFLRLRPMVGVGLISYSLYLWHWPIIVFSREAVGRELSFPQAGLAVLTALLIAGLSWQFIEQPFRGRNSLIGRLPLFAGAATALAVTVGFGNYVIRHEGVPSRLPVDVQRAYAATFDVSPFGRPPCFVVFDKSKAAAPEVRAGKLCALGNPDSTPVFLVWGDSHAGAMAPALDEAATRVGVAGLFAGHTGCPPLPDVERPRDASSQSCADFNTAVRDLVASRHIPLVFLIGYWPKYVHASELPNQGVYFDPSKPPPLENKSAPVVTALDRLMADLTQRGTRVALVMDVPEMGHYMPEAVAKAMMSGASTDVAPPWDYVEKRQALSRSILTRLAAKYGAAVVDPLPEFCSNGHCDALRDGLPMYKDADHITATMARSLTPLFVPLLSELGQPLTISRR